MTDISAEGVGMTSHRIDYSSAATQRRVKARYRSEARFKSYGLVALVVAAVFLVVLLADILMKGVPAFWQHALVLDVPVTASAFGGSARPEVSAIRSADYFPITRDALKAAIPGIESRSGERTLTRLLSTGAADDLRDRLVANPGLVGQTLKVPLLLSSDADLYFKGAGTKISSRPGRGIATPSGTSDEITILTSSNDFADDLVGLKRLLAARASQLRTEAERLQRFGGASVADKVDELRKEAVALQERYDKPNIEEVLDDKLPSLLVAINGGLVKVTKLNAAAITGDVLLPLKSTAEAKGGEWKIVNYATAE
ncbi:MAG: DUF3333 domain-containing protein, partial [Methylibium sp.]